MTQIGTAPRVVHVSLFGLIRVPVLRRSMICVVVFVAIICALMLISLLTGEFPIPFNRVVATLSGQGTPAEEFVIYTLRLPRMLTGVLAGAALGASGAVYQSVTRNALGSPDIIGFTYGAAFGAVFAIVILDKSSDLSVTIATLIGGLGVAVLVYVLSYRGGVIGYRLILVGIGISGVMASFISYLLLKARVTDAQQAYVWLTGSLNGRDWNDVLIAAVGLAIVGPILIGLGPGLRMSEMGDDTARGLGTPVERNRMLALAFGAVACAVAVVVAGPITFVALAAPQIARRVIGSPTVQVIPSMAMGALILLASDMLAQRLLPTVQLPVGITTLILGGAYLAWVIAREGRGRIG